MKSIILEANQKCRASSMKQIISFVLDVAEVRFPAFIKMNG